MAFPFRISKNGNGTVTVYDVDIFKIHDDKGFNCDERWMLDAIQTHNQLKMANDNYRPSLIIGHNEKGQPEKPAVGFFDNLRYRVGKLFADVIMPFKLFKHYIAEGRFPNRSVEVFPRKRRITALALLGGTPPHFALKQMTPYDYSVEYEGEQPVWIQYEADEPESWCKQDYQADCSHCDACKNPKGDKEEMDKEFDKNFDRRMLEVAAYEGEMPPEEEEEEEEEETPPVAEQEEEEEKPSEEVAITPPEEEEEEEEGMKEKAELHSLKAELAKVKKNYKEVTGTVQVLTTANNALQYKRKEEALQTYCGKLRRQGIAIDVPKTVKFMMDLSDKQLEQYKEELESRPKMRVPMKRQDYGNVINPYGSSTGDPEVDVIWEEGKEYFEQCGLTKEDVQTSQYSLCPEGAAPSTIAGGQPKYGSIVEDVVAYQGEDYDKE